jgi:hypothetical protein
MPTTRPALTFHRSRGHFRVDSNDEPALVGADLGSELHIWQTIGLRLNPEQARELAALLTEWSDST